MRTIRSKLSALPRILRIAAVCSVVLVSALSGCHEATAPADSTCCIEYGMWVVARGTVTGAPITPDRRVTIQVLTAGCDSVLRIGGGAVQVDANGFYQQGIVINPPRHYGPLCLRAETPNVSEADPMVTAQQDSVIFGSGPDSIFVTLNLSLASR